MFNEGMANTTPFNNNLDEDVVRLFKEQCRARKRSIKDALEAAMSLWMSLDRKPQDDLITGETSGREIQDLILCEFQRLLDQQAR